MIILDKNCSMIITDSAQHDRDRKYKRGRKQETFPHSWSNGSHWKTLPKKQPRKGQQKKLRGHHLSNYKELPWGGFKLSFCVNFTCPCYYLFALKRGWLILLSSTYLKHNQSLSRQKPALVCCLEDSIVWVIQEWSGQKWLLLTYFCQNSPNFEISLTVYELFLSIGRSNFFRLKFMQRQCYQSIARNCASR